MEDIREEPSPSARDAFVEEFHKIHDKMQNKLKMSRDDMFSVCRDEGKREILNFMVFQPVHKQHSLRLIPGSHRVSFTHSCPAHSVWEWSITYSINCALILADRTIHRAEQSRLEEGQVQPPDIRFFSYLVPGSNYKKGWYLRANMKRSLHECCPILDPDAFRSRILCQECTDSKLRKHFNKNIRPHKIDIDELFGKERIDALHPGTIILGDLSKYGFVLVKSIPPDMDLRISMFGHCCNAMLGEGVTPMKLNYGDNRFALYNSQSTAVYSSDIPPLQLGSWGDWMNVVRSRVLNHRLGRTPNQCHFITPNILFNDEGFAKLQRPHTDFNSLGTGR